MCNQDNSSLFPYSSQKFSRFFLDRFDKVMFIICIIVLMFMPFLLDVIV